jgi:hypothetical protein
MDKENELSIQDKRLVMRMADLWPLQDKLVKEIPQINAIPEFSKVTTFITQRPILREVAFYYLYHNKVIDYVKVFTAENIKDIYFHEHPDYNSFYEVGVPIVVILLGTEMYNQQMITILNLFSDNFLSNANAKALIFCFEGSMQEFKNKYKNVQERGILNTGKTFSLTKTSLKSKDKFEM